MSTELIEIVEALDAVDVAIFTGDSCLKKESVELIQDYAERWIREISRRKANK